MEIYLSNYVFVFKEDGVVVLFHSLLLRKIYGRLVLHKLIDLLKVNSNYQKIVDCFSLAEKNKITVTLNYLLAREFLIASKEQDASLFKSINNGVDKVVPTTLRLLITNKCNFACTYCQIEKNLKKIDNTSMSKETAGKALKLFQKSAPKAIKKTIILTGGETLLNFDIIKYVVENAKEYIDRYRIILFTNGVLITKDIANYFAMNRILVLISLDGYEEINDKARIYRSNRGTFNDIIRGYNYCKDIGCEVGFSAVLGKHNVKEISKVVDYFIEMGIKNIGLNFPHYLLDVDNPELISMEEYTNQLIKMFRKCREKGVFLEYANRPLEPFIENKLRLKECSALGKGITIDPYGTIGTCKTLITAGILNSNIDAVGDVDQEKVFLDWAQRSTLTIEECKNCPAQGICGTGCAYDSYCLFKTIDKVDFRACVFSKTFLEFMIWDLYAIIKYRLNDYAFYEPTIEEQRKMYGRMNTKSDLSKSAGHQTGG